MRPAAAADQTPRPAEKKPRPDQNANCPRCNSTNTKFCYYNNYSLSQPRFFCKTCRRYWTEGGTLRNVPVGGGSRRKHMKSSSSKKTPPTDLTPPDQNPKFSPIYNGIPQLVSLPFCPQQNPNFNSTHHLSFVDLLNTTTPTTTTANFSSGSGTSVNINTHANPVFDSNSVFSSGLIMHEIENNGFGVVQDHARTGFTFEEPKPVELPLDSNGYWNGVLPGGSNW